MLTVVILEPVQFKVFPNKSILKFMFSKKVTKIDEIYMLIWRYVVNFKIDHQFRQFLWPF